MELNEYFSKHHKIAIVYPQSFNKDEIKSLIDKYRRTTDEVMYLTFGEIIPEDLTDHKFLYPYFSDIGPHLKYKVETYTDDSQVIERVLKYMIKNTEVKHYIHQSDKLKVDIPTIITSDGLWEYLHIIFPVGYDDFIKLIKETYPKLTKYDDILTFTVVLYINVSDKQSVESYNALQIQLQRDINIYENVQRTSSCIYRDLNSLYVK